jgi:phospholipid/cholesterol/gamma-HCH transport system substrate-binding protein
MMKILKNKNIFETIIGFLIIITALYFFIYAKNTSSPSIDGRSYQISAKFSQIDGITIGSDIRIAGIKVGTVVKQELDNKSFEAKLFFAISRKYSLPIDSTAKISSPGFFGKKYINIEPGADEEIISDEGEIIYTQSSINLETLIGKFMFQKNK